MLLQMAFLHSFLAEQHFIVYTYRISFIYSCVDVYLSCYNLLAIVNSAAMNIRVHGLFNYDFLRVHAQEWHCQVIWQLYFQVFKEPPYYFPQCLYKFTFPPIFYIPNSHSQEDSLFSTSSPAFSVSRFFHEGHSERCEMILHYSFGMHFSNNQ